MAVRWAILVYDEVGRCPVIIIMDPQATEDEVLALQNEISEIGFRPFMNPGVERKVSAVLGELDVHKADLVEHFQAAFHCPSNGPCARGHEPLHQDHQEPDGGVFLGQRLVVTNPAL